MVRLLVFPLMLYRWCFELLLNGAYGDIMLLCTRLKAAWLHAGTGLLNGRSEQLLGQFVNEYPGSKKQRDSVCIATKLAPYPWRLTSGG